ncbi:hypothetical protein TNCV_1115761 [Trichonephila clavipes]|nr:hypothetical protein TNCV_1115761 [Trichonephila clavipes]
MIENTVFEMRKTIETVLKVTAAADNKRYFTRNEETFIFCWGLEPMLPPDITKVHLGQQRAEEAGPIVIHQTCLKGNK